MKVFAQLSKVDEEKRLVYGIAAKQMVDHSGEQMDYAKSKPNFIAWSDTMLKDSNGLSMGNIRAMHGNIAAGKMVDMTFDDTDMSISICAKVVDDNEWQKVLEGVYTGFSMGGKYGKRWKDGDVTHYVAVPTEISLVDRPCIPDAKFFDIQKADGSTMQKAFQLTEKEKQMEIENEDAPKDEVIAKADTVDYQVEGTEDDVVALGKMLTENNLTLSDAIKALSKSLEKAEDGAVQPELKKGMYEVRQLSDVLSSIYYLTSSIADEAEWEGDNSLIPAKLKAVMVTIAEIFKELVVEETDELLERAGAIEPEVIKMTLAGCDLVKMGARNSKADAAVVQKMHDLANSLGADCTEKSPITYVSKSENTEDLQKIEAEKAESLQKAIQIALEPMQKALTDAQDEIKMLKSQPMPTKGVLRVIAKSEDYTDAVVAPQIQEVKKSDGSVDAVASMIKMMHKTGGVPVIG